MENKTKLKSCKMYEEDGKYYLDLKYTVEKIDGIYEKHIPKVALDIPTDHVSIETIYQQTPYINILPEAERRFHLKTGFQYLRVEAIGPGDIYGTEILIKKKTRKMTLAEIEKELGYSVEVVSKK